MSEATPGEAATSTRTPAATARWPAFAPWVGLGVALAFELLAVIYEQSQDWGFLGNLWLIFVIAGVGIATTLWLSTWTLLSAWSLVSRLVYFVVGLGSLAAITAPTIRWWENDWELAAPLATILIGVALPQVVFWRRGGRIQITPEITDPNARPASRWIQFSIGDMLLLTTGLALMLSLTLIGGMPDRAEWAILGTQVLGGNAVFLIALTWPRYLAAVALSLISVAILCIAGMAIGNANALSELSAILMVTFYAGPATIGALTIVAIVRSAGYRLRR
jgi:hypothetical protein